MSCLSLSITIGTATFLGDLCLADSWSCLKTWFLSEYGSASQCLRIQSNPVRFDTRSNVLTCRFELVRLMQVTEDQRDHINRTPKEEEVYHKLLRDLEPSFEEED